VRNEWLALEKCSDRKFFSDVVMRYPLSDCLSAEEKSEYNQNRGIYTYFDPFADLFCVLID